MRRPNTTTRRSAFTLMEMLLATAIGLLLLSALYVALDMQFRFSESARDTIQHATLLRSLKNRMQNDITASLGPSTAGLVQSGGGQSSQGGQTSQGQSAQGQTGQTGTTDQGTQQSQSAQPQLTTTTTGPQFSLAVSGDSERMTLYITRLPPPNATGEAGVSDIRRISYWMAGGGGEPMGLARQEVTMITADDAQAAPGEVDDESSFIIAPEVKTLSFQYFDGTTWQDSWDGSSLPSTPTTDTSGTSTTTPSVPVGPPLAIAIVIGLPSAGNPDELKTYRHVVAIPTANGIR